MIVTPCLSRDGSTLVFRQLFDLYAIRLDSKPEAKKITLTRLADGKNDRKERRSLTTATQAAFTADGLEIAFVAAHDLWVMDTELREPRQVTATGGEERKPVFSPEGDALFFLADVDGKTDVNKAERRDAAKFWWLNRQFTLTRVTQNGDITSGPRVTPDGMLSYQRGRGDGEGYPQDRKVYATWSKPIVVLCNQNSFSNAEIFSHAIKTLKRGQLVGVRTAGGVISTGAMTVMDIGMLRMPTRGWYSVQDGQDMELNGAAPHHVVWPEPGDLARGKDAQLSKGVEVLLGDVEAWKQRPRPKLEKATERKGNDSTQRD